MEKCLYCGGDKFLIPSGDPCPHCPEDLLTQEEVAVSCLTVPDQYRSVMFDHTRVSDDVGVYYAKYLYETMRDITNLKLKNKNIFIGSPAQHSKKIWAFACIQQLFRRNVPVFPLLDLLEVRRIMQDLDRGKEPKYLEGFGDVSPHNLYTCPYLFVIIPPETNYEVYDTMSILKDRRVRRGLTTIFLYSGTWQFFAENDRKGNIKGAVGDGSYGTIENKSFWVKGSVN